MGRFTINLPGDKKADVQWGIVRKNKGILAFFKRPKQTGNERISYVVKVDPHIETGNEYRLFKTTDEEWSLDADGRIPLAANNFSVTIQQAIYDYETNGQIG